MRIAVILKPENGCSLYRCELPCKNMVLSKEDEIKYFYTGRIGTDSLEHMEDYNPEIIFFNGITEGKNVNWFQEQRKKGVKLVMDVDDYWELGPNHPVHAHWYKFGLNLIFQRMMQVADLVFTTNEELRNKILPFNKNCVIVPNAIPFGQVHYKQDENTKRMPKMNFLYSGGSTHYPDVMILKNKFDRIGTNKSIQDKAIFTLAGYNPLPNTHCKWDMMASVFKRTKSFQILNTQPLEQHMSFYDNADVCLVPLVNNEFNRKKSFIKIIEAATRELPCIVSDTLPYSELKDFPGLFWDNWLENINYSIKNPIFVKDKGKELAEKIKEKYDLSIWALTRYQVFNSLMN